MSNNANDDPGSLGTLGDEIEALLDAEREIRRPPQAIERRVRARVAASVVAAASAGMAGSAAAAGAGITTTKATGAGLLAALTTKATLIAAAVTVAGGGVALYRANHDAPAPSVSTARAPRVQTEGSAVVGAESRPNPTVIDPPTAEADPPLPLPLPHAPAPRHRSADRRTAEAPTLRAAPSAEPAADEKALLAAALAALARGEPSAAVAALEQHARRFTDGQLVEEREALWVQALVSKESWDEARARAEKFQRRFPHSIQEEAIAAALAKIPR